MDWDSQDSQIVRMYLRWNMELEAVRYVRKWLLRTGSSPDLARARQIVSDIKANRRWTR